MTYNVFFKLFLKYLGTERVYSRGRWTALAHGAAMSRASFIVLAAAWIAAPCAAVSPAVNPFGTLTAPIMISGQLPLGLRPDSAHVFASIAATLHLGGGSELIQQLENSSSIDHLHDYRGEAIFAVKPELLGPDGGSRIRDRDGNYPFFVFRQLEHGWLLLGQMQGRGYEWTTQSRHLVFNMSVQRSNGARTSVRYEVNSGALVNLNELALAERRHEKVVLDVQHSF